MLLEIKGHLKNRYSYLYNHLRHSIFPVYNQLRNIKLKRFKGQKLIHNINFRGVNYKLQLDYDNGFVDQEIFWKGVYEEEVMEQLLDLMNRSPLYADSLVFLDIGANIGQELVCLSRYAAVSGRVNYSGAGFEPIPKLAKQIEYSLAQNNIIDNKARVYNYALGLSDGELRLRIPKINVGGSSLVRTADNTVGELEELKIRIRNGDLAIQEFFKTNNIDKENEISMIMKIDVEGYEYEVVQGLMNTIKKYKPNIILEYSPAFYIENSAEGDRRDIGLRTLELFVRENYTMRVIDVSEYKDKLYSGEEIVNWGRELSCDQANILLQPRQ